MRAEYDYLIVGAGTLLGGRLGSYRYYDMDKVVRAALDASAAEIAPHGKSD